MVNTNCYLVSVASLFTYPKKCVICHEIHSLVNETGKCVLSTRTLLTGERTIHVELLEIRPVEDLST